VRVGGPFSAVSTPRNYRMSLIDKRGARLMSRQWLMVTIQRKHRSLHAEWGGLRRQILRRRYTGLSGTANCLTGRSAVSNGRTGRTAEQAFSIVSKAPSTPATMWKQHSILLPKTATMLNDFIVKLRPFDELETN